MSIAFVFWLLTKLSAFYITTTIVQLEYVLPKGKILTFTPPKQLEVEIKGEGWVLMARKKSPTITFDLTVDSIQKIDFQQLRRDIGRTYSNNIEITNITPSQLELVIDNYAEQDIPLALQHKISILPQYQLAAPLNIAPENIKIKGPQSLINKIKSWQTELLTLSELDRDMNEEIDVAIHPNEQIEFEPAKVEYQVLIENYTEKIIEIPVQIINASDSLKIFPQTIRAVCTVGLSDYDRLKPTNFTAVIDLLSIDFDKAEALEVELIEQPNFVRNISYFPKKVDFLIYLDYMEQ